MKNRGIIHILILLSVATFGIGVLGYLAYKNSQSNNSLQENYSATPTIYESDISKTETYSNEEFGFQFSYPHSDFRIWDNNGNQVLVLSTQSWSVNDHSEFNLIINKGQKISQKKDELQKLILSNNLAANKIVISDIQAEEWILPTNLIPSGYDGFKKEIILEKDGFTYYFGEWVGNQSNYFDQILSTFKFLDKNTDHKTICESNNGVWLKDYNECESMQSDKGLNKEQCESSNGKFNECDSACRHKPESEVCISVCVGVCKF